jgi:cytosine/adenosine deaminase-related metal-dependent hydrolase
VKTLLIKNIEYLATFDDARREIKDGALVVHDNVIDQVGTTAQLGSVSADFIAVKRNQLGLSGTERDPLAALIMCGPFKVDYSFINGREMIRQGEFASLDVDELLASHRRIMTRIYQQ